MCAPEVRRFRAPGAQNRKCTCQRTFLVTGNTNIGRGGKGTDCNMAEAETGGVEMPHWRLYEGARGCGVVGDRKTRMSREIV